MSVTRIYVMYGQGGFLTSIGMAGLAMMIRDRYKARVKCTEHSWWRQQEIVDDIMKAPREDQKALIGFSLGANSIPPITQALAKHRSIKLAVAYDPSIWSPSSRVVPGSVERCILYHGVGLSILGHAILTGPTVEVFNCVGFHELMDFDIMLHNKTLGYLDQIVA